ncbi:MAG: dihydropteroate synthase [Flavobacteriales bacterium]|nr:dihydropteroate synthase [Flavobacteriales bacterium]
MHHSGLSTNSSFTLNLCGTLHTFNRPVVMGILNITPDSFYKNSRVMDETQIIKTAGKMLEDGGDILDIGGQSTRPGAIPLSEDEEMERVIPAIQTVKKNFPTSIISVDTFYSSVAQYAVDNGASIVNDINAGSLDGKMIQSVARLSVPYILMHMQGTPQTMLNNPVYKEVVNDIIYFFSTKIAELRNAGVNDIVLDPGFGFGKTMENNYTLLRRLDEFKIFGLPVLAGLSRKKMIQTATGSSSEGALNGTTAANMIALINGARILRVHDVKEAVECANVFETTKGNIIK